MYVFRDRVEAGARLGERLARLSLEDPVVLGLPRGGVPVAAQVARRLSAPLDVIVVRKLGVPSQPELAMGAIGEGGTRVLDERIVRAAGVGPSLLAQVEDRERAVLEGRVTRLRSGRPGIDLTGRTAVIVDDGIATGATARVACLVARALGARWVVVAVPVGPPHVEERLPEADLVVCLERPWRFRAVGAAYDDFEPTSDDEVTRILAEPTSEHLPPDPDDGGALRSHTSQGPDH
ncbi:MAG: phosphoribosyltransferase [Intrasporangium sp.]|uniref:phosphoribosyltransferase n=1 Tax=Intrasporangium sp. TaxID=1925024 RepID=UPI0026486963|nr:phosphoribosyltransferase family protein [Intrasporangium sp.]MDN5794946.1 phosphoribosyltransferase [Intrasporangium sp.]